jgi:hypothetical protein
LAPCGLLWPNRWRRILNANNEVFGFYNGSSQYLIQREYYEPTYAFGLRWSPRHEK